MGKFLDKICTEIQNTHFMVSNCFPESRRVYEIMWKKYGRAGQATDDSIIRCVKDAFLHAGYVRQ